MQSSESSYPKYPVRFVWSHLNRSEDKANGMLSPGAIDWLEWQRAVGRKRKLLTYRRRGIGCVSPEYLGRVTYASFRLEGLEVTEEEVVQALMKSGARQEMRSRQSQRIRNHVAILRAIEMLLRRGQMLSPDIVLRWYTSIGSGLSTSYLTDGAIERMKRVVRWANVSQPRLAVGVRDVSLLYVHLLNEPLVPSFNGILARLILRYHLGRNGLPGVLFDPEMDRGQEMDERRMIVRMAGLIDASYGGMVGGGSRW